MPGLEGALKLKEIAYVPCEAYAGGVSAALTPPRTVAGPGSPGPPSPFPTEGGHTGSGRGYTVTLEVTDDWGNQGEATVEIQVPHSK